MDVFLHESAEKFLKRLEKKIQSVIKYRIKRLKGLKNRPDLFRLRIGEYRVIYFVQEDKIWITEIISS